MIGDKIVKYRKGIQSPIFGPLLLNGKHTGRQAEEVGGS